MNCNGHRQHPRCSSRKGITQSSQVGTITQKQGRNKERGLGRALSGRVQTNSSHCLSICTERGRGWECTDEDSTGQGTTSPAGCWHHRDTHSCCPRCSHRAVHCLQLALLNVHCQALLGQAAAGTEGSHYQAQVNCRLLFVSLANFTFSFLPLVTHSPSTSVSQQSTAHCGRAATEGCADPAGRAAGPGPSAAPSDTEHRGTRSARFECCRV